MNENKEIKASDLQESIKAIKDALDSMSFYIENGATLKEYCDTRQTLENEYDAFMKDLSDYVSQEDFKELERLENELKNYNA